MTYPAQALSLRPSDFHGGQRVARFLAPAMVVTGATRPLPTRPLIADNGGNHRDHKLEGSEECVENKRDVGEGDDGTLVGSIKGGSPALPLQPDGKEQTNRPLAVAFYAARLSQSRVIGFYQMVSRRTRFIFPLYSSSYRHQRLNEKEKKRVAKESHEREEKYYQKRTRKEQWAIANPRPQPVPMPAALAAQAAEGGQCKAYPKLSLMNLIHHRFPSSLPPRM
ncbi:hypothetical protein QBC37DRAFT_402354 [Rhypophila decipiens]|uniref:Uncharacterized protein n=1 Tax=Rhypophila decipiens TaxID=261697 RepID=A0AAN7B834_9PEZI|nr:hypothetical protein QBC37DRAFT_402354 [Rhypophila decipiens]